MDPVTLAAGAAAAVSSYVLGLGGKAVEEGAKETGKAVAAWVKGKLTSDSGKAAVADIEAAPDDPENRDALKTQIVKLLKADPAAAAELAKLLPAETIRQTNTIVGDNNIGINASGSTVNVRR